MKSRIPWKTKRILRNGLDFTTPARKRRYRRLMRPSLSARLPWTDGHPSQWYDLPVVQKIWEDNRRLTDRALRRYGYDS